MIYRFKHCHFTGLAIFDSKEQQNMQDSAPPT